MSPDWLELPLPMTAEPIELTWRAWFDRITSDLGVPSRIFQGSDGSSSYAKEPHHPNLEFIKEARKVVERALLKAAEENFPEWFWDRLFISSPRGAVYIRRKAPKLPTITWEE